MNNRTASKRLFGDTPRRRLLVVVAGGVLLLLGFVWARLLTAPRLEVRLPNDRQVKITAVTYGTRHRHAHGPPWVKPFAPFIPAAWQRRLGIIVVRRETDRPTLMVWGFAQTHPLGGSPPDLASLSDLRGFEIEPVRPQVTAYPAGFQYVYGWEFSFLPHQENRLLFRLYERDRGSRLMQVAELPLKNPAPRDSSMAALPTLVRQDVTNTHGRFALLSLGPSNSVPEGEKTNIINFHLPRATALLKITTEGRPQTGWSVADLVVGNRAGDRALARAVTTDVVGDYLVCGFDAVLWPSEPFWLLQFGFVRLTDLPADVLATIGPFEVPTRTSPSLLNTQVVVAGSTLHVSRAEVFAGFDMPHLRLPRWNMSLVASLPPDLHLSVARAHDERGTSLRAQVRQRYPGGEHLVVCEARPESRFVTIQFAVQRPVRVQFAILNTEKSSTRNLIGSVPQAAQTAAPAKP